MAKHVQIGFTAEKESNPQKENLFREINWKIYSKTIYNIFHKLIKILVKSIVAAILCVILFKLFPELREYIPSLEKFAIWFLQSTEYIFRWLTDFLDC